MSNVENNTSEKKKINLKEAIQQQLERKKQTLGNGKNAQNGMGTNQKMKSQQHKKTNNTRRKMGS